MIAINRSNAVIEFDLNGNVMYANDLFCNTMGYKEVDIVGKHHSMFVEPEYKKSQEYIDFWEKLRDGNFVTGECARIKSDGDTVWLQSSYNPIIGFDGKPYKIMKICQDVTEKVLQSKEIEKKNTYLEHAAKILRHDMHSGINTYIPRGMSSLDRRLSDEEVHNLKIEAPLRMIREGLKHAQKVYKGVYEFTNLVKKDVLLSKAECNIKGILNDYLSSTSYKSQVLLDDNLPTVEVNEALFCTSVDNLIRNGLKYNDSDSKFVKIYSEAIDGNNYIVVEDNGRGIDQKDFEHLSKPYVRKEGQKETGTGLGLNICKAILDEHKFEITAEKLEKGGTKLKIKYA
jgi:PAS domain S-box-containing protein